MFGGGGGSISPEEYNFILIFSWCLAGIFNIPTVNKR